MTSYELVKRPERFRELEAVWQNLWSHGTAGVFQSYHWIKAWWDQNPAHQRLHVVLAWDAGELVGVMALSVHRWRGVRILEWAAQSVSDYCEALAGDENVVRGLWAAANKAGGFDIIRLKNVHPDTVTATVLREAVGPGVADDSCLLVQARWANGEDWFRTLNKKKRNNYARGRRMLDENGPVVVSHICHAPAPELIERLVQLKLQWMQANGLTSACDAAMVTALVAALDKLGALRLVVIACGGRVVAGSINIVHGGRLMAYYATYDPVVARASPGITLMAEYIRWAFDNGIKEVDFLRGEEVYKYEFANEICTLHTFVAGKGLLGGIILSAHRYRETKSSAGKARLSPPPSVGSAYFTEKGSARERGGSASKEREQSNADLAVS